MAPKPVENQRLRSPDQGSRGIPVAGFPSRYNNAVTIVGRDFKIRDFAPEDFETLWRIDQECFAPGISYTRQELKTYIRTRGAFTLVASGLVETGSSADKIAGFIVGHAGVSHAGTAGHIITIDVVAEARRSGVGSLLLRAAEDRLRAAGCRFVGLETAVDNLAALAFYKRHGYVVVRTWPRYYSNGVDALVLKKQLEARA